MKEKIPHNKIFLEPWQKKFIKENFFKLTNPQIARAIGLNLTTTRKHCYRMGFKRMFLEYWDEKSIRFLRLYYKKIGDTELAEIFTRHFPKNKGWSKKHIEKKRRYLLLKRTQDEILSIKKRNTDLGRFAECAAKRWATIGINDIGHVAIWNHGNEGRETAFIKTDKGYIPRNRYIWQQAYGKVAKNEVIRAFPNAPVICELHHLEKITTAENGIRNKKQPRSIIKTLFKIKDNRLAEKIASECPEIVEMKLKMLNLKTKINERNRIIDGTIN